MALDYSPQTWVQGLDHRRNAGSSTAITAARLNHLEQGVKAVSDAVDAGVGGGGGIDVTVGPTPPSNGFWVEAEASTVAATAPTFTDPSGTGSDTYTIPTVAHVEYRVGGVAKAAGVYAGSGSVTVTAHAIDGYILTGTASWSHTFSSGITVTATAPTFDNTADNYVIPATTGVDYKIGGSTVAAGTYSVGDIATTVTVTAVAQSGYTLTGTTSWTGTYTVASPLPLIIDTFTAADETALTGRTTDASGASTTKVWGGTAAAAKILSNQAAVASTSATTPALLDHGAATYKLTVTAVPPVSAVRFYLRYVDLDNCVFLEWRTTTNKWGIISRSAATNTLVLDTGVAPVTGDVVEITADGTGYSVKVNGGAATVGANTYLASNTVIGIRGGAGARWDNLKIETI